MRVLRTVFAILLLIGVGECLPCRFLWPFGRSKTVTTTTHARPPHPAGVPTMIAQTHSSHLQVRPMSVGSYLENRPTSPLVVGSHHHHHHLRPMVGTNAHLHGGAIAGMDHQHHYHVNQQHHHHPHISRPLLFNAQSVVQA